MKKTIVVDCVPGRLGLAVIFAHEPGRAYEYFSIVGHPDFDARHWRSDSVEPHVARALHAHGDARLGHAIQLFEIDAQRAIKIEEVGADGFTAGIRDLQTGHAEHVFERAVHQPLAEHIQRAINRRDTGLAFEYAQPGASGYAHEKIK